MMRKFAPLVLLILLAACGSGNKETGAGKAEGEILPGSASDAMLPVDTVRSQPPLAPVAEHSGKPGDPKAAVATDAATAVAGSDAPTDSAAEAPPAAPDAQ